MYDLGRPEETLHDADEALKLNHSRERRKANPQRHVDTNQHLRANAPRLSMRTRSGHVQRNQTRRGSNERLQTTDRKKATDQYRKKLYRSLMRNSAGFFTRCRKIPGNAARTDCAACTVFSRSNGSVICKEGSAGRLFQAILRIEPIRYLPGIALGNTVWS